MGCRGGAGEWFPTQAMESCSPRIASRSLRWGLLCCACCAVLAVLCLLCCACFAVLAVLSLLCCACCAVLAVPCLLCCACFAVLFLFPQSTSLVSPQSRSSCLHR